MSDAIIFLFFVKQFSNFSFEIFQEIFHVSRVILHGNLHFKILCNCVLILCDDCDDFFFHVGDMMAVFTELSIFFNLFDERNGTVCKASVSNAVCRFGTIKNNFSETVKNKAIFT